MVPMFTNEQRTRYLDQREEYSSDFFNAMNFCSGDGGRNELGADIAFAEVFLVHMASIPRTSLRHKNPEFGHASAILEWPMRNDALVLKLSYIVIQMVHKMIVIHLQDILTERSMSRRELARRSGLNINTVCKLANNANRMIDLTTLDQMCKALQVQPGELLVRELE